MYSEQLKQCGWVCAMAVVALVLLIALFVKSQNEGFVLNYTSPAAQESPNPAALYLYGDKKDDRGMTAYDRYLQNDLLASNFIIERPKPANLFS